ncbi:MAG: helix-turn-helix transcriptional regulator [Deferribacteraceae bacterium]|nr:helix-turn-helix transcriptional regulator [Deferribacteraceae bacterium]
MKNNLEINESLRMNLGFFLLLCFALPSPTNVGMTSLFVLPVDDTILQIVNQGVRFIAGYIVALLFIILLPRYIIKAACIAVAIGLVAVLAMFLPLSPIPMAVAYCLQNLCDIFVMGLEISIVVHLFSKKTAIKAACLTYILASIVIIVLDKGLPVSFTLFKLSAGVASLGWLYFYCKMPKGVWARYVQKGDGVVPPRMLFVGIYTLLALGSILTFFGESVAMSVPDGFTIFYTSTIISCLILYSLWQRSGIDPFRTGAVLISLGAIGFGGMVVSVYIPVVAIFSCMLIGASATIFGLITYYGGVFLAERYPSRFIAPLMIIVPFCSLIIYYLLEGAMQDNTQFMYAISLLIAIVLTTVYLLISPYLRYSLAHDKPLTAQPIEIQKANNLSIHAFDKLSGQELRLAELIMQGYTQKEIVEILRISDNTVRGYRKSLYSKLQIHSRKELFDLATPE